MLDVAQLVSVRLQLHFDKAQSFLDSKVSIFWLEKLKLSFREHDEQLLHCNLMFFSGISVQLSIAYAKSTRVRRHSLWHAIEGCASSIMQPWFVIGDFNIVSSSKERVGDLLLICETWKNSTTYVLQWSLCG